MVYKEHFIEIWVNGHKLELIDQASVNIRFNSVLFDPTKITSSQAEYSFEFDIPATPQNNTIFDYANNLSKVNKFHQRYNAEVYADGDLIFEGTVVINEYKDKMYSLNLVSVKVHSLEEIFGDKTMDKIDWKIPFEGAGADNYTMDYYNNKGGEVTFPMVCYGAFPKDPYRKDSVASDFTSKFDLDKWNKWYVESFPPSPNMLETVKKAFDTVGYNVAGNVFQNPYVNSVYMSTNLADGQSPDYNVGNPKFGMVNLRTTVNHTAAAMGSGYQQELHFPYFQVYAVGSDADLGITSSTEYNLSDICIYDLLSGGTKQLVDQSVCYMYQPNENVIVIPADGMYKIELSADTRLLTSSTMRVKHYLKDVAGQEIYEDEIEITPDLRESTPVEIQLVRNYDDNIELIKGRHNKKYYNGNPNDEYYEISGVRRNNITSWYTNYPHEDPYNSILPSEKNDLTFRNTHSGLGGRRTSTNTDTSNLVQDEDGNWSSGNDDTSASGNFSGRRGGTRGSSDTNPFSDRSSRDWSAQAYGYCNHNDYDIMAYDQAVSTSFICGITSLLGGHAQPAVMKNGYSWSTSKADKNESFYEQNGYDWMYRAQGQEATQFSATTFNKNEYKQTPSTYMYLSDTQMVGELYCIVKLNKNDILQLVEVHRAYEDLAGNAVNYDTKTTAKLKITAFSPRSYNQIKASSANTYPSPVEFDDKLNIANFFNKETKIVDFVNHVVDAYNLEVLQDGNTVTLDVKKKLSSDMGSAVDIDDRVCSDESDVTAQMIEYPRSMAVRYKINGDEWGFERSAVDAKGGDESILDEEGWQKWADSGYTVIELNDDTYATQTSDKSLQFSYTWYDDFKWYEVGQNHQQISNTPVVIGMPVISKFSYMIDGYSYEESMKHDGFGYSQRLWYRPYRTTHYVYTDTYPQQRVTMYLPTSVKDGMYLSYKNTEKSVLTEFFNVNAYLSSNYVELDVYLTPEEYNRIKNGSLVHFDSDLYYPVEISGYDPSGTNPTTIRIMKKVV